MRGSVSSLQKNFEKEMLKFYFLLLESGLNIFAASSQ